MSADFPFSDYIVYVDESGHASPEADPNFPCFVLAFCLFEKDYYRCELAPSLQRLKFEFFGHDMVIFHEREIRKSLGEFAILRHSSTREAFFKGLNSLIKQTDFSIIYHVIRKDGKHKPEDNLYHIAAQCCLEQLYEKLRGFGQEITNTHVVFEQRGRNEDAQLELEFRRICSGENRHQVSYPFTQYLLRRKPTHRDCSSLIWWLAQLESLRFTPNSQIALTIFLSRKICSQRSSREN